MCYWNDVVRFPTLPTITTLAVRHLFPQFGKKDCKALLKSLVEAKATGLVNLQLVRFLDERNLKHLRRHFSVRLCSVGVRTTAPAIRAAAARTSSALSRASTAPAGC